MKNFNKHKVFALPLIKQRGLMVIMLFLALCVLTGCAGKSAIPEGAEVEMERTTFSFTQQEHPYDLFPTYLIAPGDELDVLFQIQTWMKSDDFKIAIDQTLQIKFMYAPELNDTQKVRFDGNITLPYVGDVYVAGKSTIDLTKELTEKYRNVLQIPEISITITDFRESIKELKADLYTAARGLSRLVTVRPDGHVTFPLAGDLLVAGLSIPEVNKILNDKYASILPGLHCDLSLEKHSGSQIHIVGQVRLPGAYNIQRPVTIMEALALAEDTLPGAKLDSIFIVRKHDKKMVATRVNLESTLTFDKDSKFFYVMPNDIVFVPKTWLSGASEVARQLSDILFFKGYSLGFSWELHNEPNSSLSR